MAYTVIGARGDVGEVDAFLAALRGEANRLGLRVQAFDADMVFGEDHLRSAWEHAERSFRRGTNVADDLMVEVLVWASGERQISTALEKMGVKAGSDRLVLLARGEGSAEDLLDPLGLKRDDTLVEGRREMLPLYGIGEVEMETVPEERLFDLVLERVALVQTLR